MTVLYDYSFESSLNSHSATNTGDWDSETDADGDMSQSTEAGAQAVASTSGALKVVVDDSNQMYLTRTLASGDYSGVWRARFYFDPNSVTWPNSQDTEVLVLQGGEIADAQYTDWPEVMLIKFGKNSGGSYIVKSGCKTETDYDWSPDQVLSDKPHWIECEVRQGSSASANDGSHKLWIDSLDSPVYSDTAVDNFVASEAVQYCYFGIFQGSDTVPYSAPGGTIYLDELIVNNTGDAIGAASGSSATGTAALAAQAASASGSGAVGLYPAYGYATPDAGEVATSWTTWHLGAGAAVSGDADYGGLDVPPGVTCDGPVVDMGDASTKQITASTKYGTNLGSPVVYLRGSDTTFLWDAGSPSWTQYSAPVTQAWRYAQLRVVGA